MKIKYIFIVIIFLFAAVAALGCSPKERVRVDLDSFVQNKAAYEDKEVLITASIGDVLERYELYRGKKIEISAPVTYYGRRQYWTWYMLLEQDDQKLRAYTHYYRLTADRFAIMLLEQAKREDGEVKVVGKLRRDGLEVRKIIYDDQVIRTDMKPRTIHPYGAGYWGYW